MCALTVLPSRLPPRQPDHTRQTWNRITESCTNRKMLRTRRFGGMTDVFSAALLLPSVLARHSSDGINLSPKHELSFEFTAALFRLRIPLHAKRLMCLKTHSNPRSHRFGMICIPNQDAVTCARLENGTIVYCMCVSVYMSPVPDPSPRIQLTCEVANVESGRQFPLLPPSDAWCQLAEIEES